MTESFKSKRGFHPCDYTTFEKLKTIKKWYYEWLHAHAEWERWYRKEPQNRLIRRTIVKDGLKTREIVGPRPEPVVCPYFGKGGTWFLGDFDNARMPRTTAEEVMPLSHTIDQINQLYFKIKTWKENLAKVA